MGPILYPAVEVVYILHSQDLFEMGERILRLFKFVKLNMHDLWILRWAKLEIKSLNFSNATSIADVDDEFFSLGSIQWNLEKLLKEPQRN